MLGILPDLANYYYQSGLDLREGINPYLKSHNPVAIPPPALAVFHSLSFASLDWLELAWLVFSIISLVGVILLLVKNQWARLAIIALSLLSFPVKFTLGMGQMNLFILLFIALNYYFYLKKRDILSGLFLGLALIFKMFPVFLIFYFLIKRKFKIVVSTMLTVVFIFALALWKLSLPVFISFFSQALPGLLNSFGNTFYYNQSLSAFVGRILGVNPISHIIYLLLALILFLITLKSGNYFLFLTANVLLGGISWQHHLVFLLPGLIVIYQSLGRTQIDSWFWLALVYFLLAINIEEPYGLMGSPIGNLILSHGTLGTLLLWFRIKRSGSHCRGDS